MLNLFHILSREYPYSDIFIKFLLLCISTYILYISGVGASNTLVKGDLNRLKPLKDCFIQTEQKTGMASNT